MNAVSAPASATAELRPETLQREQRLVLDAFALAWSPRPRTWIAGLLADLDARGDDGKRFTGEALHGIIRGLVAAGWLVEAPAQIGTWQVAAAQRSAVYLQLLDRSEAAALRRALGRAVGFDDGSPALRQFPDLASAAALVRLEIFSGRTFAEVERLRAACSFRVVWADVVSSAVLKDLDEGLFLRLEAGLQRQLLVSGLSRLHAAWTPSPLPLVRLASGWLAQRADESTFPLRLELAVVQLWSGDLDAAEALVQPLQAFRSRGEFDEGSQWPAYAEAVGAAAASLRGRFAGAEAGYESALAQLRKKGGKRKNLLPEMMALPYVLALLAQQGAAQLDKALKFCLAESGKKQPEQDTGWGLIGLAIQMRRGDVRSEAQAFRPLSSVNHAARIDVWRWLMRAWLHTDTAPQRPSEHDAEAARLLLERITGLGMARLGEQVGSALALLQGRPAAAHFFVPSAQEGWRHALAALASLGGEAATGDGAAASRLVWVVAIDARGSVESIVPHEQKRGPRGWNKPREVPLARLAKAEKLQPADAQVARAIRVEAYSSRAHRIDLAAAIGALIGHPAVEFDDAPGTAVALLEGQPELDVVDAGDSLQVRLLPALAAAAAAPIAKWPLSPAEQRETEALRLITVVREGAQRARVIRLTPAQKRAAQLIGDKLAVPKAALGQLQQVLQGLGAHFQVHADGLKAARDVAADSRLRAELAPQGDGVSLRLVVAPFGLAGPRVAPGRGRTRMIAAVGGETLGAQRDLALERSHVDAVTDACGVLTPLAEAVEAEWLVPNAEDALALVEQLPKLAAIAGIDWPKGQPIHVETVALGQLQVRLRTRNDWLALQGGVTIDEQLVFGLEQVLEWQGRGGSRFVPLGEGRYLALTAELRTRLAELASVAEAQKDGLRVAPVAASWLAATLDGATTDADAAFGERIARLETGQQNEPPLPPTLQAELRPYQLEGYRWAMRLADAGFGACLADDMGLGKTLQALAVLLARAADGPALIVAPTSLGGNWSAEARRFAPALNLRLYHEGDRATAIERAGPGDAIAVSYQLLQLNVEAFAARRWQTLVLDEAQAIKNATAKRSLAVFQLQADFKMALSGTPIENRLSELWSIMRVCNPGLLGTLARFNQRFATPIERDHHRPAQRTLRRLIAPFVLRRTKAQVLDDLPPRTEQTIVIEPGEAEAAHYEALRRQALASAEASLAGGAVGPAQISILAQLMRLRRAACDPRLVSPQLGIVGAKVQAFGELAAELAAGGHKALVFSQFVDFLSLLREPLDAAGIAYQYLDGATPAAERSKRVAAFQAGHGELFLISLKAGGFGLNLTVADYVVIADPWWNPAAEDQASGRAHRIGQLRPVTVYRLVNQGTLEERIVALHQNKRDLADSVLEGGEGGTVLKAAELVELIRGAAG